MKLTLDAAGPTLAEIDLGEPTGNYYDEGALAATCGNLYLNLDGVEYGSLFFYRRADGAVTITLGQFDHERQEWVDRVTLDRPVDATGADA